QRVAGVVVSVNLAHLGNHLPVGLGGAARVRIERAHHQADGLAIAAGYVLPAAFEAVVAAARHDAAGLDLVTPRRGRILHQAVRVRDAAAGEHRLNVVLRDAVARDPDYVAGFQDAYHGHGCDAQLQPEAFARDFLGLGKRGAGVIEQARRHAQHAPVALEAEG